MFLEKLKLQLFAADDEVDPVDSDQDEEVADDDDETIDETEEDEDEAEDENDDAESEDDKPFMVFKSKDEHQQYMDNVIGKRLGDQREAKKKQEEYDNLLETFKQYFEVDDIDGLKSKADELLDDIAYQKGTTKEKLLKQQNDQKRLKEFETMQQEERQKAFINAFTADCTKLSKTNADIYGDIKSDELIQNKEFLSLLGSGVPFKQAYDALHVEEIIKKQTSKAKKNVIDDVKAKGKRISENATKKSKSAVMKIDINKLTDAELADLEERAANGERISF